MGYIAILLNLYMDFMYSLQNRIIVELISEKFDTSLNIYKEPKNYLTEDVSLHCR